MFHRRTAIMTLAAAPLLALVLNSAAIAQAPRRMARVFLLHPIVLVQLDEVRAELKLTDEQAKTAEELRRTLAEERGAIWAEANNDWDYVREEMTKLNADLGEQFDAVLDDAQRKRCREIYVQINGALALHDPAVVEQLKLDDDQRQRLEAEIIDNRNRWMESFGNWQSMSDEERVAKTDELIAARDMALLAVLSDEQRAALKAMEGAPLEVDLDKLPRPGL